MKHDLNENQTRLMAQAKAIGRLDYTKLWGQDTKDAQALVRMGLLKRSRHSYVAVVPVGEMLEPGRRGLVLRGHEFTSVSVDEATPIPTQTEPVPQFLTQDEYAAIRMFVNNGHALHPDQAQDLLHTFEALWRAADMAMAAGVSDGLCGVMFDDEGNPRLKLGTA